MTNLSRMQKAGLLLIVIGVVANKWTLAPLATDGQIGALYGVLFFVLFQFPLLILGAFMLAGSRSGLFQRTLNTAVLLGSVVFAIVIAEVALRMWPDAERYKPRPSFLVGQIENRESRNFIADALTGWRMKKNHTFNWSIDGHENTYRSNSQGFRSDQDYDSDAETGPRIVIVGDSFSFGTGVEVEETFGILLQSRLAEDVVVQNLAMPGFGLDQMWMSVKHQVLPTAPDLVIVAFIDNDLDRSLRVYRWGEGFNKPTFHLSDGGLRQLTAGEGPGFIIRLLDDNSYLWTAYQHLSRDLGYRIPFGNWWSVNEAIFKSIADDSKKAGVPVLLVRLPLKEWRDFPNLRRVMEDEQLNLLDLGAPEMRPSHAIHFATDGHINRAGHSFVADALYMRISPRFAGMISGEKAAAFE